MAIKTLDGHIEVTQGVSGGKPRIAGHRITVQNIVIWHERIGKSADEIAAEHGLALSDVYAALAYYYDHQVEIDRDIEQSKEFVRALKENAPSKLKQKLHGRED